MTSEAESTKAAPETRSVDLTIEIEATPEQVWQAITDGEELTRWFPPIASAEPGPSGHVTVSWGGGAEWTSDIKIWSPGIHLRLEDRLPPEVKETGVVVALDYHLERRGSTTVVRLVNSGFSPDDEWDDYYHMVQNGWTFFLWNLKHYLERHPGKPRAMASVRPWVSGTRAEVWNAIFSDSGLGEAPAEVGESFTFRLGDTELQGVSVFSDTPWSFAGKIDNLDDGVLHSEMEGSGERWKAGVWLSAYGEQGAEVDALKGALEAKMTELFPNQADA